VTGLAFSPDGKILAGETGPSLTPNDPERCEVRLWDIESQRLLASLNRDPAVVALPTFSPHSKLLATGGGKQTLVNGAWIEEGQARLWDAQTGQERFFLQGHSQFVNALAFSPDGRTLATGSDEVRLWDTTTGQLRMTLTPGQGATVLAYLPDGIWLAGTKWAVVSVWDAGTGKRKAELRRPWEWVGTLALFPDGNLLATGSGDGEVKLWDTDRWREQRRLLPPVGPGGGGPPPGSDHAARTRER
jgi:dipeptidyl aminopeptidase/acylaminoacyl peptidase